LSLNINDAYLKAKESIEEGEVYKYDNFYFSVSISEVIASEYYSHKINRIKATGNFLKIPFGMVDWPNNMSPKLRKEIWDDYVTKNNSEFVFRGITKVDEGRVGNNVFVVLGINLTNQNLEKIRYEEIINKLSLPVQFE
tara:strand:+ start:324 stop:740 length:417 start_codon:yes stop_codon:yes gene_type:complete